MKIITKYGAATWLFMFFLLTIMDGIVAIIGNWTLGRASVPILVYLGGSAILYLMVLAFNGEKLDS